MYPGIAGETCVTTPDMVVNELTCGALEYECIYDVDVEKLLI